MVHIKIHLVFVYLVEEKYIIKHILFQEEQAEDVEKQEEEGVQLFLHQ